MIFIVVIKYDQKQFLEERVLLHLTACSSSLVMFREDPLDRN